MLCELMNICDYVISICMREFWNLMIVEQDVKKYELCALYIESKRVMICYLMAWKVKFKDLNYDVVLYILNMRSYGMNYAFS